MILHYAPDTNRFYCESSFDEKDIPKQAKFWWSAIDKYWWTNDVEKASRLINFADDAAKAAIESGMVELNTSLEASHATDAELDIPVPYGLSYLPYQKAGIAFSTLHNNVLIADEMGLGKTIQALGVINYDDSIKRVLIVVPATLKINWNREADKWLVRKFSIGVASGTTKNRVFPDTDIVIINYDIIGYHLNEIHNTEWDLLVIDEVHYLKNPKSQRTKNIFGHRSKADWNVWEVEQIKARRKVYLTGTPIVNRPVELWPILHNLDPGTFKSFWYYAKRYCGAVNNGYGWDLKGASNLDELQKNLRANLMIRRLKADVLKDLPAKVRQVIEIPADKGKALKAIKAEQSASKASQDRLESLRVAVELAKVSDDPDAYSNAVAALREGSREAFEEMAAARKETALIKAPIVADYIKEYLEDNEGKIIVFAHHYDVVDAFMEALGSTAVRIDGRTSMTDRQAAVDAFQNDPAVRVFVGTIKAAGVGITLTAANRIIFAELDWVPGNMSQAEDRAHRIGQTDTVFIQHLVLEGSIDATMANTLVEKQAVIDKALDDAFELNNEPILPIDTHATASVTKSWIAAVAEKVTEEFVVAVHNALRILAGMCDGAHEIDGLGFNKMDTNIGKSLALVENLSAKQAVLGSKIVLKYHRQIPDEVLESIKKGLTNA